MWRVRIALATGALVLGVSTLLPLAPSGAVAGPIPKTALLYDPSVAGGASSLEAQYLDSQGWTVTVVSGTVWDTLSAGDFASYRLLVIGDPECGGGSYLDQAISNEAIWAPTANGNILVIGADPVYHILYGHNSGGADHTLQRGLDWAGKNSSATGLYLDLSCNHGNLQANAITNGVENGFTVASTDESTNSNVVGMTPSGNTALGITSSDINGWHSSVHEMMTNWPGDFVPAAVVQSGDCNVAGDGVIGCPYILARGDISGVQIKPPTIVSVTRKGATITATMLLEPVGTYLCTLIASGSVTSIFVLSPVNACSFTGTNPAGAYAVRVQAQSALAISAMVQMNAPAPLVYGATCAKGHHRRHLVRLGVSPVCPIGWHRV